jgi:hypothetical protein
MELSTISGSEELEHLAPLFSRRHDYRIIGDGVKWWNLKAVWRISCNSLISFVR